MSIAKNIEFLRGLPRFPDIQHAGLRESINNRLKEEVFVGQNPGNLAMYTFLPKDLPPNAPLVVVLHGCTQTAPSYDVGAGWSTLAERYGFALLMPSQRRSNNANGCFNWFELEDTQRDCGEACSIRQMIEQMVCDHRLDRRRIFVTGLSAGGAMTSVMLAVYPELFAAGAVIAGLPYGVATNLQEALARMSQSGRASTSKLGDLIRTASRHNGPWPRVSVWHGSSDRTVNPINADCIVNQWLDVHGLVRPPMSEDVIDGYPHQVWWNSDGKTVVESFTITGMAHGTPLGLAENEERYGLEGAFLLEVGISSSYHIAKFFGLIGSIHKAKSVPTDIKSVPHYTKSLQTIPVSQTRRSRKKLKSETSITVVINNALKAAGLMK